MGILRRSKQPKKPRINYKGWIDYERLVAGAQSIRAAASMFVIPSKKVVHSESLEHVMQRLHLTDKDIQERKQVFLQLFVLMLIITGCLLTYSTYLLIHQHFHGAIVSLALSLFTLGMFFRYHFWYFQLKQGKLGCDFMEWLKIGVLGLKK